MTILAEVKKLGQQIWLDNLSRSLIQNGTLAHQLAQGVCGVTSNPAIFQKAFANDDLYQNEIHTLKKQGLDAKSIYEHLAIADVQAACDVCRDEFEQSGGTSGWVSLEVSPDLAHRAEDTITEAKRLHTAIQRPNVMIKVPATDAGLTALTDLVSEGISVNLTLLFSRTQTQKAYAAYQEGLTKRLTAGKDISTIQVVASFFISRIDAALDPTLPDHLQGKIAIALAKAAYQDWQNTFTNDAFKTLVQQHHANPVRLLWASTGVKNPNYSPTLYVDSLIGEHTINTVPEATLNAFCQSGRAATTLNQDSEQALTQLHEVAQLDIDLETLAHRLQEDGLKQFEQAFDALLKPLAN